MNMSSFHFFAGLFLAPALFLSATVLPSLEAAEEAPAKDWLEFYYENPRPDQFVSQMKDWADEGTLDNESARPALIAFISQIIRQNEGALQGWYQELTGLSPGQRQVLHTAMLFSRTTEADRIMHEAFGERYEEQKQITQKILEMPLDKEATLDMLWGYFYATGSESAIRRMVVAFSFKDVTDHPPGVTVPDGYVPLYKELPEFVAAALIANAQRHPRLVKILRAIYEKDESLQKVEKEGLYDVLSALDPKTYPPLSPAPKAV